MRGESRAVGGGTESGTKRSAEPRVGADAAAARIRVLIVDEHPVIRGVVRAACEASSLEVVGEAASSDTALELAREVLPDVIVLDPSGEDGFELAGALRGGVPSGRVLVLTGQTDGETVLRCLRMGVSGVISKSSGVRSIAAAIAAVAGGEQVLPDDLGAEAVAELGRLARRARGDASAPPLTERELEALRHLARGLTIRQASTRMGVSPSTVESHVTKLYRKLGVRTRVQAIARGVALGLIDIDRMGED